MQEVNRHQHLILDDQGTIIKSCDTLFLTKAKDTKKIGDFVLFTKNILPYIKETLELQDTVTFKKIHAPALMLPGLYDFVFTPQSSGDIKNDSLIECSIIERTGFYEDLYKYWQNAQQESIAN